VDLLPNEAPTVGGVVCGATRVTTFGPRNAKLRADNSSRKHTNSCAGACGAIALTISRV
jgi:hypothetical protein